MLNDLLEPLLGRQDHRIQIAEPVYCFARIRMLIGPGALLHRVKERTFASIDFDAFKALKNFVSY
jgi:hypothetical protein